MSSLSSVAVSEIGLAPVDGTKESQLGFSNQLMETGKEPIEYAEKQPNAFKRFFGKPGKSTLFKSQSILATILISILLAGNMALFIWSNVSTAAIVWMDVDAGALGGIVGSLTGANAGSANSTAGGGILAAIGSALSGRRNADLLGGMSPAPAYHRAAREELAAHTNMFSFSLSSSVEMMWESETYWLAIMIVVASGAWPYIKIVIMAVSWFVPMTNSTRTRVLRIIEFLGKWSLIDMYVLVIMVVAFPVAIAVAGIEINILVEPVWGFYSFLIAALWNMANTQVIGLFHYRQVHKEEGPHDFVEDNEPLGKTKMGWIGYGVGATIVVVGTGLIAYGLFGLSYNVETSGLAIEMNQNIEGDSVMRYFSALTTGTSLPDATYPDWAVDATMVIYLFFTVGTPLLWCLISMVLWLVPMRAPWKYYLARTNEFVFSWSAADVFLMSIGAAVVELHQLAEGTMPDFCKQLADLTSDGKTCYSIYAGFEAGFWVLLAGIVCLYVMHFVSLSFASKTIIH